MAVRAICLLPVVTGAWKDAGGGLQLSTSQAFAFDRGSLERPDLQPRPARLVNMARLGHALTELDGPAVQALVVYNSNPAAIAPNSAKVLAGLKREDLFTVVLEHFMTDTADHADIVLPATTQLEHWDIHTSYGHTDVLLNRPAINPLGEARSNTQIFRDLARAMGFDDPCFADSDETLCRTAFDGLIDRDHRSHRPVAVHGRRADHRRRCDQRQHHQRRQYHG